MLEITVTLTLLWCLLTVVYSINVSSVSLLMTRAVNNVACVVPVVVLSGVTCPPHVLSDGDETANPDALSPVPAISCMNPPHAVGLASAKTTPRPGTV